VANKSDTWMPLYIADYLRKTMHLTRDQHGGYMLLLMACWDRGGRLPNDQSQLAGIAKASPSEWRKIGPVLMQFFDEDGEHVTQSRVVDEYEKAARISEARRQAGLQGGRPPKPKESKPETSSKPNGLAKPSQTETPAHVALPSPSTDPSGSAPNGAAGSDDAIDPLAGIRAMAIAKGCWRLAVKVLVDQGGLTDARARAFVGKLKAQGVTDAELWQIAESAFLEATAAPQPYLIKAAEGVIARRGQSTTLAPEEWQQRRWMAEHRDEPTWWRPERGPAPGEPGCRVTAEIQREFGVEPAAPAVVRRAS
jgi:uncharacterized protein YdaU (DUF1376 family)